MRNYLYIIIYFAFCSSVSCNADSKSNTIYNNTLYNDDEKVSSCDSALYNKVANLVSELEPKGFNRLIVEKEFINSIYLYFSDPGYISGPEIEINKPCWTVKYSTTTFNDDETIKYTDEYSYSFIIGDSIVIYKNRYNGKMYHGGRTVIQTNADDDRYRSIRSPLITRPSRETMLINSILNDSILFSKIKDTLTLHYKNIHPDISDFIISPLGLIAENIFGEKRICYALDVSYSVAKNETKESHLKLWRFDIENQKCFYLSEIRKPWTQTEPYRGSFTSNWVELTNEDASNLMSLFMHIL